MSYKSLCLATAVNIIYAFYIVFFFFIDDRLSKQQGYLVVCTWKHFVPEEFPNCSETELR